MAFVNPYGDPWSKEQLAVAADQITDLGICSISLADTVGSAQPDLIRRIVTLSSCDCDRCDVGVHLHSRREEAGPKILAAYDAGCRSFYSALCGLGVCPFAQD